MEDLTKSNPQWRCCLYRPKLDEAGNVEFDARTQTAQVLSMDFDSAGAAEEALKKGWFDSPQAALASTKKQVSRKKK